MLKNYARLKGQVISFEKDHSIGELIIYKLVLDTDKAVLTIMVPDVLLTEEIKANDWVDLKCQLKFNKQKKAVYINAISVTKFDSLSYYMESKDRYVNALIFEGEYLWAEKDGINSKFYFKQKAKYSKDVIVTIICPTINFVKALLTLEVGKIYNLNCNLLQEGDNVLAEVTKYRLK